MKSIIKNILSMSFSVALAALFLYFAFRGKDITVIWHSLIDVHWSWFIVLFVGSALSHLLRAWRWKYLLHPMKEDVSLRNVFSVTMIGYLINNVVPRLGEFVRPYAMKKLEGISKSATMGTIILERILDIVTFALVVLTVLAIYAEQFGVWFPTMAQFEWLFFVGAIVMMVIFVLIFLKADALFRFLRRFLFLAPQRLRGQVEKIFDSFLSGFRAANHTGNYLMIAITSVLIWVSYIILLYIPFFIYDFSTQNGLNFGSAAVLLVASGLAFAMPTPSGIGSYHSFTSFVLIQIFSIDAMQALSYAVYTHAVGFLTTTILGLYYFFVDKIHVRDAMVKTEGNESE
ncbi:MAG: lysylphosphatidylglycerol synthase transmembrane domain-containing protein [Bacteroidota bacterium]|nr:lysylphosphatidylglycerol synthase transmembrane domain-containing protein [Bacteroidota bacterium]